MNKEDFKSYFLKLSSNLKLSLLCGTAHYLTIHARGCYHQNENNINETVEKLCAFNELQHLITAHIHHLVDNDTERYSDEVFMDILLERAVSRNVSNFLMDCFDKQLNFYR